MPQRQPQSPRRSTRSVRSARPCRPPAPTAPAPRVHACRAINAPKSACRRASSCGPRTRARAPETPCSPCRARATFELLGRDFRLVRLEGLRRFAPGQPPASRAARGRGFEVLIRRRARRMIAFLTRIGRAVGYGELAARERPRGFSAPCEAGLICPQSKAQDLPVLVSCNIAAVRSRVGSGAAPRRQRTWLGALHTWGQQTNGACGAATSHIRSSALWSVASVGRAPWCPQVVVLPGSGGRGCPAHVGAGRGPPRVQCGAEHTSRCRAGANRCRPRGSDAPEGARRECRSREVPPPSLDDPRTAAAVSRRPMYPVVASDLASMASTSAR